MRTQYDLEMMQEVGYCNGIENYSAPIDGRGPGEAPNTLLDFFPDDFLLVIDESHVAVPQLHGQYEGDRSRKEQLIEHGFRLPSAADNRPAAVRGGHASGSTRWCSCRPRRARTSCRCRPRSSSRSCAPPGLVDPEVIVKPTKGQIDDLIEQINERVADGDRVLVTTLTKKMAEDLTEYLLEQGLRVRYLHCNVDTIQRIEILRDLRLGEFDVLVGINLLREGLDLPEVSLVAILDADKEGFLRSETSLIQTMGRAARNVDGQVVMYADKVTDSMRRAISETQRRRELQLALQRGARHRPADDPQGRHRHPRHARGPPRRRPVPGKDQPLPRPHDRAAQVDLPSCRRRARAADPHARGGDARRLHRPALRVRRPPPRRDQRPQARAARRRVQPRSVIPPSLAADERAAGSTWRTPLVAWSIRRWLLLPARRAVLGRRSRPRATVAGRRLRHVARPRLLGRGSTPTGGAIRSYVNSTIDADGRVCPYSEQPRCRCCWRGRSTTLGGDRRRCCLVPLLGAVGAALVARRLASPARRGRGRPGWRSGSPAGVAGARRQRLGCGSTRHGVAAGRAAVLAAVEARGRRAGVWPRRRAAGGGCSSRRASLRTEAAPARRGALAAAVGRRGARRSTASRRAVPAVRRASAGHRRRRRRAGRASRSSRPSWDAVAGRADGSRRRGSGGSRLGDRGVRCRPRPGRLVGADRRRTGLIALAACVACAVVAVGAAGPRRGPPDACGARRCASAALGVARAIGPDASVTGPGCSWPIAARRARRPRPSGDRQPRNGSWLVVAVGRSPLVRASSPVRRRVASAVGRPVPVAVAVLAAIGGRRAAALGGGRGRRTRRAGRTGGVAAAGVAGVACVVVVGFATTVRTTTRRRGTPRPRP